ncbi:glycosyltransferase family 2 protein [Ferrimonas balearica]|uniref:glycosyltransferase family 2 protein n=1 Tax=Ferrimonas balearica TaxID=44012 RepID=UPI001C99101E|nr:glycosyltransferase [Ferrimonas balearica]MBY5994082.1 glycosyltransferase [Ferrimonas balearica]
MVNKDKLSIYIFSYNRGRFLENAVASCLRFAEGASVCVVDDNSEDPETCQYLDNLPEGVGLLQPDQKEKSRHGGLYNNMQSALDSATSEWVLFIQDDMQLVRPVEQDDLDYIDGFFSTFTDKAFLNPVFLRGRRLKREKRVMRTFDEFPGYYRELPEGKAKSTGYSYVDAVIGHRDRLRQANWTFEFSERANAAKARKQFGLMGIMASPFVMFLPQVPVYRGNSKTLAVALAERLSGHEPKRFVDQDPAHWAQFKSRSLEHLPVAEDYLVCEDDKVVLPYVYNTVNVYPPLRALHKVTLSVRNLFLRDNKR